MNETINNNILLKGIFNSICFNIGQIVYLKTDIEQKEFIVVGYSIRPDGTRYILAQGTQESFHYGIEVSSYKEIK
jgi:hypothetical protein